MPWVRLMTMSPLYPCGIKSNSTGKQETHRHRSNPGYQTLSNRKFSVRESLVPRVTIPLLLCNTTRTITMKSKRRCLPHGQHKEMSYHDYYHFNFARRQTRRKLLLYSFSAMILSRQWNRNGLRGWDSEARVTTFVQFSGHKIEAPLCTVCNETDFTAMDRSKFLIKTLYLRKKKNVEPNCDRSL